MSIKLSILICTTSARSEVIKPLLRSLKTQFGNNGHHPEVELIVNAHETDNVGKKRNTLLHQAQGEYIIFVDSDDEISPNYVSLILKAIESKPDCVAINGIITTNGKDERKWFISKDYLSWYMKKGIYYRTPNHISPVRRELALKAGFPEVKHAEDYGYSMRLFPLLKTETIITEPIYHYKYVSNK